MDVVAETFAFICGYQLLVGLEEIVIVAIGVVVVATVSFLILDFSSIIEGIFLQEPADSLYPLSHTCIQVPSFIIE